MISLRFVVLILLKLTLIKYSFSSFLQHSVHKQFVTSDSVEFDRQEDVFVLFRNIFNPNYDVQLKEFADGFNVFNPKIYKNSKAMDSFKELKENTGLLKKLRPFTLYENSHKLEAISVFEVYESIKETENVFKVAVWMRQNLNENLFIYSTLCFFIQSGMELTFPAPYEVNPFLFFSSSTIESAKKLFVENSKNEDIFSMQFEMEHEMEALNLDHTEENQLNYFSQDPDLNTFYFYQQLSYPTWLKNDRLTADKRGELFLFEHQQLLARYNLERIGNNLSVVQDMDLLAPVRSAFFPFMSHPNGLRLMDRLPYYYPFTREREIDSIIGTEERLERFIDFGKMRLRNGTVIDLRNETSVNELGNLVEGNVDSLDKVQINNYFDSMKQIFGGHSHSENGFLLTNALLHPETQLRDPVFYQIVKRIVNIYNNFKTNLEPYPRKQLKFQGVAIKDVEISKIGTFFLDLNVDLTNALWKENEGGVIDSDPVSKSPDDFVYKKDKKIIVAKTSVLNHDHFGYKIFIHSRIATPGIVRVFLGPAAQSLSESFDWNQNRGFFFEIDKFKVDLDHGLNSIYRFSSEFNGFVSQRSSFVAFTDHLRDLFEEELDFEIHNREAFCGFPQRLLFPKTSPKGVIFQLYFIVSPFEGFEPLNGDPIAKCGIGSGRRFLDRRPLGFPFDRPIPDQKLFVVPNSFHKFVNVTHRANKYHY